MHLKKFNVSHDREIGYYRVGTGGSPIVFVHAQSTSSESYFEVVKKLSANHQIYLLDCYGHGGSSHRPGLYHLQKIGDDMIKLINDLIGVPVTLVGHSSGGLIAAYIASKSNCCAKLILEDAPFFASQGDRRFNTYNYVDLSTVCHNFLLQKKETDFVLYYFKNQYAWNFFPEKNRHKMKQKLVASAERYRRKHPDKNLKVMFWPKSALKAFYGMNQYDPRFGEAFFSDSFNQGIDYETLLSEISCPTLFLKAKTNINEEGLQRCALTDEDLEKVVCLIPDCRTLRFDCGHGIHLEKPKEFLSIFS